MKYHQIYLAMAVLVLATLACQAVMGGEDRDVDDRLVPATETIPQPENTQPTALPSEPSAPDDNTDGSESKVSGHFPMTPDAFNIVEAEDGSVVFYTQLSPEEVIQFYRDEFTSKGYMEREDLTISTEGIINLVFDGDPSGKAIVIQSVDLGDGSRTISIRLEDV